MKLMWAEKVTGVQFRHGLDFDWIWPQNVSDFRLKFGLEHVKLDSLFFFLMENIINKRLVKFW